MLELHSNQAFNITGRGLCIGISIKAHGLTPETFPKKGDKILWKGNVYTYKHSEGFATTMYRSELKDSITVCVFESPEDKETNTKMNSISVITDLNTLLNAIGGVNSNTITLYEETNMPTDNELNDSLDEYEEEVIELQFKTMEYPSLEEAVLEYTKEHGAYCNIFSYVSRHAGIDNELMPKTLLVGNTHYCVYSPYFDVIGKRLKQEDLDKFVNLNTGKEVTFKFIPYKQ